jgi:hypothetical protein
MSAWLQKGPHPADAFFLRIKQDGKTTNRRLGTDREAAESELAKVRLAQSGREWHANQNVNWKAWRDLARFADKRGTGTPRFRLQRRALTARAVSILGNDPAFSFLLGPPPRTATLGHLGRVQSPDLLRLLAAEICERKLGAEHSGAFVRNVVGRMRKDLLPLVDGLRRVIQRWAARHEIDRADLARHLHAVASDLEKKK